MTVVLNNINFLSAIFPYITDNTKDVIPLIQVRKSWRETIEYYSGKLWCVYFYRIFDFLV